MRNGSDVFWTLRDICQTLKREYSYTPYSTDLVHVRVARGRNYRDATPTSGIIYEGGGAESLEVDVRVVQLSS